jgi:hypothetical protein
VRAYNSWGPAADAYAAGTRRTPTPTSAACSALGTSLVPGTRARILAGGVAAAPAAATAAVQAMITAGKRISHFLYSYGGGHGDRAQTMNQTNPDPGVVPGDEVNGGPGYDCSSATSYVLWGGGFGPSLLAGAAPDSTGLESVGEQGPGRWATIYANAGHTHIEVAGIYFDTVAGLDNPPNPPPTGPRLEHGRHRTGGIRRPPPVGAVSNRAPQEAGHALDPPRRARCGIGPDRWRWSRLVHGHVRRWQLRRRHDRIAMAGGLTVGRLNRAAAVARIVSWHVASTRYPLLAYLGVRTAATTDTCSGPDALLLQSQFAGVSGRDALAPAGRPERAPGRNRWGHPHPWDSGRGVPQGIP